MKRYAIPALICALAACNNGDKKNDEVDNSVKPIPIPVINYRIVAQYPHDTGAYTQGLQLYNGKMYEGTGDYQNSSLRITNYKTGKVEKSHNMGSDSIFGEGITILNGKIYQLTWQSHVVYVYDLNNIDKPARTFQWASDGWGITNDGKRLIVSDGTASLYFVNPDDFRTISSIRVIHDSKPIEELNELEYIDGFIYANVYTKDVILKIDPANGHVVGQLDLSGLPQKYFPNQIIPDRTNVLNGIAYDSTSKHLLITGKRWPKLFEVKLD